MTKSFKFSSLLAIMLVAVSANVRADEEVFGEMTRAGCCPQTGPICDLKVKNNVWVGGTLNAQCINVKCCGQKCPVMVSCEKCVHNVRGRVELTAPTIVPYELNTTTTTPLNINVLTGCGIVTTTENQVFITDVTQPFIQCGLIGIDAVAATAEVKTRLCLEKPCQNLPAVVSTLELEPAGSPFGPLTFDLSGQPNPFDGGMPFPANTFVSIQTVEVVVNEIDAMGCFKLNIVVNFVACSSLGQPAAQQALQTIINVLLATPGFGLVGPKLDFIAQCSTACP